MNANLDINIVTELLQQLLTHSHYKKDLDVLIPHIAFLANENEQLSQAIHTVLTDTDFLTSHKLNWHQVSQKNKNTFSKNSSTYKWQCPRKC